MGQTLLGTGLRGGLEGSLLLRVLGSPEGNCYSQTASQTSRSLLEPRTPGLEWEAVCAASLQPPVGAEVETRFRLQHGVRAAWENLVRT